MPLRWIFILIAQSYAALVGAQISVVDDAGRTIALEQPARRIVSLAPNTTELLFAAGAGSVVVGVGQYSDFPEAAKHLPQIGNSSALDFEAILALRPDLVVGWKSGNPATLIERLRTLGLRLYLAEPRRLEDIPSNIERLGVLAGTAPAALRTQGDFNRDYAHLRESYAQKSQVSVFYQIWDRPLMTVNGMHMISAVLTLCGGQNVFAELPVLAPSVSLEAVLAANPQAIVGRGEGSEQDWRAAWRKWPQLEAVRRDNLVYIAPELIERQSPRILLGARQICTALDAARTKRR